MHISVSFIKNIPRKITYIEHDSSTDTAILMISE